MKKILLILFFLAFAAFSAWILYDLPSPQTLETGNLPVSTKIFDRNGKLIYEIYTNQRRTPVKLEELPDYIKQATIAIEDKDFYKHHGFSITGIGRAVYKTVFQKKTRGWFNPYTTTN